MGQPDQHLVGDGAASAVQVHPQAVGGDIHPDAAAQADALQRPSGGLHQPVQELHGILHRGEAEHRPLSRGLLELGLQLRRAEAVHNGHGQQAVPRDPRPAVPLGAVLQPHGMEQRVIPQRRLLDRELPAPIALTIDVAGGVLLAHLPAVAGNGGAQDRPVPVRGVVRGRPLRRGLGRRFGSLLGAARPLHHDVGVEPGGRVLFARLHGGHGPGGQHQRRTCGAGRQGFPAEPGADHIVPRRQHIVLIDLADEVQQLMIFHSSNPSCCRWTRSFPRSR